MGKKCELDKFYTNPEIVKNLLRYINLDSYDFIIEPSAGNGSFFNKIKNLNSVGLDIEPEDVDIQKQDWFEYKISEKYKNVLVLGNPPFGERNNLSREFIRHAIQFNNVKTIAFILPNVYKKHTNQKVFPSDWRLAHEVSLERNSFLLNGEPYHVPCSFFIWTRHQGLKDLRFNENLYKSHPDFIFTDEKNFDFFVMGASPKVIKLKGEISENNRGYYLKSNIDPEKLKNNILSINWTAFGNSSANGGVSWFSKPEFIKIYDENKPI